MGQPGCSRFDPQPCGSCKGSTNLPHVNLFVIALLFLSWMSIFAGPESASDPRDALAKKSDPDLSPFGIVRHILPLSFVLRTLLGSKASTGRRKDGVYPARPGARWSPRRKGEKSPTSNLSDDLRERTHKNCHTPTCACLQMSGTNRRISSHVNTCRGRRACSLLASPRRSVTVRHEQVQRLRTKPG